MSEFQFTNNWFDSVARNIWESLIPQFKISKILEVGSFEGASVCYLIEKLGNQLDLEIHCVDTWEGGVEHQIGAGNAADMQSVEARFLHNIHTAKNRASKAVDLHIHKGYSDACLPKLLNEGRRNYFDFIYIDGSHQAPDVLFDAVVGFRLLKVGGVMAFDDYLWFENLAEGKDPLRCPKPAIDAFINLNFRKLQVMYTPNYQLYIQKVSD